MEGPENTEFHSVGVTSPGGQTHRSVALLGLTLPFCSASHLGFLIPAPQKTQETAEKQGGEESKFFGIQGFGPQASLYIPTNVLSRSCPVGSSPFPFALAPAQIHSR